MNDEEIRAKSLEIAVQTFALMPENMRTELLDKEHPAKAIIDLSREYRDYLQETLRRHQSGKKSLVVD